MEAVLQELQDARRQLELIKITPPDTAMAELPARLKAIKEKHEQRDAS